MAPRHRRRRRLLLPAVFAVVLAIEITGLTLARSMAAPATTAVAAAVAERGASPDLADRAASRPAAPAAADDSRDTTAARTAARPRTPADLRAPAGTLGATAKAAAAPTIKPRPSASTPHPATTAYHGRNHVWIPGLGVSAGVQSFPCSRSRPPDAGVYRWGCAGRNNVYLMGHAWSTFRALHDAYVSHRLRTGMKVWYADGGGHVHEYSVAWWRVVAPTTAASWAWAAQSRPSMTLQTCVGANSQYRLMVRLLEIR
jgi:hypothetical protein